MEKNNMKVLFKKIKLFNKLATCGEDSDKTLDSILKKLRELETFKDRIDLAEKELKHLSSGSSRIIYVTPDNKVLKLAKNNRGIAQNKVEANPKMKSEFINKTLKADSNGYWKISPYLEKITEKDFKKMTGVNFEDFGEALRYGLKSVTDHSDIKKPKNFEKVEKTDIYKDIVDNAKEFDLMPGDLARISSWGTIDNHPVLLDAGLTKKVYEDFYDSDE